MTKMSETKFAELVRARLIDTEQVRELLGLESAQGVRHRVEHGWLSGPVILRPQAISLWDKEQVLREEAARVAKVEAA
jgi:hypothetical protein